MSFVHGELGVSLPGECDSQDLVLDAEGDKVSSAVFTLASLTDAGACGTKCCGSRTV